MSEIVKSILKSKTERIIQLVALATNRHATQRGDWSWKAQEDVKVAALEANLNDPKHKLYGAFGVTSVLRAQYALEGKDFPHIRTANDIPHAVLSYGAVLVPTAPVLGGMPDVYDAEQVKNAYVIGTPVMCISTWKKSDSPEQRGRGIQTAKVALADLPFLPRRADLTRPATDAEITALVEGLVAERGIEFVDDVLQNLEDAYARFVTV